MEPKIKRALINWFSARNLCRFPTIGKDDANIHHKSVKCKYFAKKVNKLSII